MDVGYGEAGPVLVVLGETAASPKPAKGTLHNPSLGQHLEADRLVGSLDDLEVPGAQGLHRSGCSVTLIAAVRENALDERKDPSNRLKYKQSAITILNAGRVYDNLQRETERIDQDVSLLALDLLASVVTRSFKLRPPFSAPLTL